MGRNKKRASKNPKKAGAVGKADRRELHAKKYAVELGNDEEYSCSHVADELQGNKRF